MAWIWSLYIECETVEDAKSNYAHFKRLFLPQVELAVGCKATPPYEVFVTPVGAFPPGGPTTKEECLKTIEWGTTLLENLRSISTYRFACVGTEVGGFRKYPDFFKEVGFGEFGLHGIVVNRAIWEAIGKPSGYEAFRDGFYWVPYRGEEVQD